MNSPLYLVAGLGKTGYSITRYLHRHKQPFIVFDTRKEVLGLADFNRQFPGVDVFLGELPPTIYPQLAGIITSPGISLDAFFLQHAFELNIPVWGDVEYFAREIKAPVIAITGTNGKSTVTTLVGEMAKASGLSVAVAGNIGTPVLDLLNKAQDYDLWVLELSSFQLDLIHSLKPLASTILNLSPDHLDRHHSFQAYANSKQRIYRHSQFLLYNRDDKQTYPTNEMPQSKKASYGLDAPGPLEWGVIEKNKVSYLAYGDNCLFDVEKLRIKGKHNWQNALAACALAFEAGINFKSMSQVLETFNGLPHRCQWVRTLDKVDWINDSKGTNVGAALSAITGIGDFIQGKIVLIAGGQGKGGDFTQLSTPIASYVRSVILIGEDASKIEKALSNIVPISLASSLDDAVLLAKDQAKPGDVVLLSPACASLDMFRDFNHRGEKFTQLVGQL